MAKNIARHISHLKSSGTTAPSAADLLYGEIAVGYGAGNEVLYIKNSNDTIIPFINCISALAEAESYADSGDVVSVTSDTKILVSLSDKAASGRTITITHANGISQNGFKKLSSDSYGHITAGTDVTISDLTGLGALSGVTNGTGISVGAKENGSQSISLATTGTAGIYSSVVVDDYGRVTSGNTNVPDTNTWRDVNVNGTQVLSTDINTGALDFTSGSSNGTISVEGVDVNVTGLGNAAFLNTGTTNSTVAVGNHTHSEYASNSHEQASNTISAMTGYSSGGTVSPIQTSDTLNQAIGKLESRFDGIRLMKISQTDYTNLQSKDENTLYIITD